MNFDIAIIGGGPAGYTAAERAGANGLKAVLFEKKAIGGVCLNEGCIPTKTLLYSAKILDSIKSASKYGVFAESPSFDLSKIMSRKDKTVKMLTGGVKMTVNSYGVTIVEKEAFVEGEENGLIRIVCDGEAYFVKYLLVCTGSDTVIPPIPGLAEVDYWTSKEALEIKELPKTLVIIGGGVIGMEFASFFNSMGVKVHIVEMMPEILGVVDKEKILSNEAMAAGDVILAPPSTGEHSNGFSLVRKIFDIDANPDVLHTAPAELGGKTLGEALLAPTKIYVKPVLKVLEEVDVKGISHITGGGFYENIPRSLKKGCCARINKADVRTPALFQLMQKTGNISEHDMFNTFNMGVGMVLTVPAEQADKALDILHANGEPEAYRLGVIAEGEGVVLC